VSWTRAIVNPTTGIAALASLVCVVDPALAAPPGHWSVAVERLFGVSHTWRRSADLPARETEQSSVSVLTQRGEGTPYAATRLGFDYLFDFGLSLGGALGFSEFEYDYDYDDYRDKTALLAPRAGFFLRPLPELGVWVRSGLTLTTSTSKATSITLEVPVIYLVPNHVVGVSVTPYWEYGVTRNDGIFELYGADQKVTEVGLSVGANAFF
jgi:hypothetical protein